MIATILIGVFFLLLALAVPIGFAMGLATITAIAWYDTLPMTLLAQRTIVGAESYSLLAIPFFILAGNLMNGGGLTHQIVRLAMALVGRFKGGLALTSVLAAMIFRTVRLCRSRCVGAWQGVDPGHEETGLWPRR